MSSPSLTPPLLFISDIHLGGFSKEENKRIEDELIQLVNYCREKEIQLIILGDLFDYWMAYPDETPNVGAKLLDVLEGYNNDFEFTPFVTGNHDYWTGKHLKKRGLSIYHDEFEFSVMDSHFLALHGDGLKNPDLNLPHPKLHQFLQSDWFIKLYQQIFPAKIGISLMKYFSRLTRLFDANNDDKARYLNSWAKRTLNDSDFDFIISGHDHIPRKKHFAFGTYINLGTFYRHRTVSLHNDQSLSIRVWNPQAQTLNPFEQDAE